MKKGGTGSHVVGFGLDILSKNLGRKYMIEKKRHFK